MFWFKIMFSLLIRCCNRHRVLSIFHSISKTVDCDCSHAHVQLCTLFPALAQWNTYICTGECRECKFPKLTILSAIILLDKLKQLLHKHLFLLGMGSCGRGGILRSNSLMGICHWMKLHFHNWIDYNRREFNTVTWIATHTTHFWDFWDKNILVI